MTLITRSLRRQLALAPVDDTTWEVRKDQVTVGYIHLAGMVYVSLIGATLSRAVEVGQSLSLNRAVEVLAVT